MGLDYSHEDVARKYLVRRQAQLLLQGTGGSVSAEPGRKAISQVKYNNKNNKITDGNCQKNSIVYNITRYACSQSKCDLNMHAVF